MRTVGQPDVFKPGNGGDAFLLVYGAEAVIPPEVSMVSPRVQAYDEAAQYQLQRDDVDLVDEGRWQLALQNARYRQTLRRYHQWFVHSRHL
jgi:hypothetical protein